MDDIRDIITGYREALEQEELLRNAAFLDVPELVGGVECQPFTLRHWCVLQCIGSPFVVGGVPSLEDVSKFLWSVNKRYNRNSKIRRYFFIKSTRKLQYFGTVRAIQDYLEKSFCDFPGGKTSGFTPAYWSCFANIISELAKEHGWDEQKIMDMPLKRIWQYIRVIRKRQNPNEVFSNTISGAVRQQWLNDGCKRN